MARRRRYNHKRRRGSLSFLYKLLAFVLICTAISLALTLFFRIRSIEVSGNDRYTRQEIIDAAGCIVTPGFVDAHCHIGMHEEASRWEGNDTNEYSGPVTPEIRAIDGINPRDEAFGNAIGGGVTTAVLAQHLVRAAWMKKEKNSNK